jgi:hypothetical protein
LSNLQVFALATAIVKQVKARGPFLSMADFLNRRLVATADGFGLKGALQAAIDSAALVNNTQLLSYGQATGTSSVGGRPGAPSPIAAQLPANTAIGVPGWLMQQDLVQCFSPVMAARSDTFVVRCYGEADNPVTAAIEGRAWGEAVVQRLPDFIDQADPALAGTNPYGSSLGDATPVYDFKTSYKFVIPGGAPPISFTAATPTPIVDSTNLTFGRRFKVVCFHWLNETDL